MTELKGTAITMLNRSESTNPTAPPTTTPGSSAIFVCPSATSYKQNAKLTIVNKAAKDIAPTFEADHAASNVARTITGKATQIFRRLDVMAL
jgi:hypothetical protein